MNSYCQKQHLYSILKTQGAEGKVVQKGIPKIQNKDTFKSILKIEDTIHYFQNTF